MVLGVVSQTRKSLCPPICGATAVIEKLIRTPAYTDFTMSKTFTAAEIKNHKTEKDCWVIIKGNVYDVTKFLPDHPGGKKAILMYGGKDATEEFLMLHKESLLQGVALPYKIGSVGK